MYPYPITATLKALPSGPEAVYATLNEMRRQVLRARKTLSVRLTALSLVKNHGQKDRDSEIASVFDFVKYGIRYVRDIRGVETLQTPEATLKLKQGDCDDKATLLSALLESIGFKTRFTAIGFVPMKFSHVFTEVFHNGAWMPLETTEPVEAGWNPAAPHRVSLNI